ncbi:glycosyltransferase family 2 protein [Clostridium perfringens]|nr:glycosyltransferase family 2 protein [Clostridium perfringens]
MNKPKVSAIVPVYNVEKYLHRCVNSLINQTLRDIEIILVDDGSPDNSPKICDEYKNKDIRIKVIHKENAGLGLARNSGLDKATGEYVAFIDSDDFIEETAFENMYNAAKQQQADMCMAGYYKYNTHTNRRTKIELFKDKKKFEGNQVKEIAYKMIGSAPEAISDEYYGMSVWKNLYSLDFLKNNNIRFYSEREFISEDAIFQLCAVPRMRKIVTMNESYYYYCDNSDTTLTSTFKDSKFEQYKILYLKELELLSEFDCKTDGKNYIARMFLGNVRNHMKQLASSNYSLKNKLEKAKQICNDELLIEILSWYPYNKNPKAQKIYSDILRKKLSFAAIILAKLQSKRN